ncbi:hypothetical protein B0H63DRAFT_523459 [Podospora didyma]|uniref:Uncharacterized protein n=1 Tax=Podospora didyma TaxID=330526 RepID=A0AAE0NR48_9PEZI|nr:hypothetical protein B0H63DRAFT_523459 [Podospora didyma]
MSPMGVLWGLLRPVTIRVPSSPEAALGRPQLLNTWLEFSWDKQGWIWGDVSPIRGCDGAVRMWSTDGGNVQRGFSDWIFDGAGNAYIDDAYGNSVIASNNGRFGSEWYAGRPLVAGSGAERSRTESRVIMGPSLTYEHGQKYYGH